MRPRKETALKRRCHGTAGDTLAGYDVHSIPAFPEAINLSIFKVLWCLPLLALFATGCNRGGETSDVTVATAQEEMKDDADKTKEVVDDVKMVTLKGGDLSGGDDQGRPLWKLGADVIKVENIKNSVEPRRAELQNARATLYRDGKPDSTFRAPKVLFYQTDEGARISMMGGVTANSAGEPARSEAGGCRSE